MKTIIKLSIPENKALDFVLFCAAHNLWTVLTYSKTVGIFSDTNIIVVLCLSGDVTNTTEQQVELVKSKWSNCIEKTLTT